MKTKFLHFSFCLAMSLLTNTALAFEYCDSLTGSDDLSKFHLAVCRADIETTKQFLRKGVDVNKTLTVDAVFWNRNNRAEFNALHTSLLNFDKNAKQYTQIIQLLVREGINTATPYRFSYSNNITSEPNHLSEYKPITLAHNEQIAQLLAQGGTKLSPLILKNAEGAVNFYNGNIVVSGKIDINPHDEFFSGMLCMLVDKTTSHLIPRVGDPRTPWFCFENLEDAITMLKINAERINKECFSGFATVEITDYQQDKNESEVSDLAKLVRVLESRKFSYKKCSQ